MMHRYTNVELLEQMQAAASAKQDRTLGRAHALAFAGMAELLRLINGHGGDLLRAEHALREALQIIETLKGETNGQN